MIPVTIEENESHHEQNTCYICQKTSTDDKKVRDHCYYTGNLEVLLIILVT